MAKVFISFVGLGNPKAPEGESGYTPAIYRWNERNLTPTPLAQVAMVECMGPQYWDRLVFLFTRESRKKHLTFLKEELDRLCVESTQVKVCPDDIQMEMNSQNQWEWFESLLQYVHSGDEVTFDFTHGMRAVPIVISCAIAFLEKAKNFKIEHVLYAFFDPMQETNPIVEMRDFYVLNQWADAVSRLSDDADARKLAALAADSQVEALQDLRAPELIDALQDMTDCIRNVEVNLVAAKVEAALEIVKGKRERSEGTARLLLDLVWEKYQGLAFEHPLTGHYDRRYFDSQVKIIEVLLEHRLFMQAFTAIRECMASIGMVGLPQKYQKDMRSKDGMKKMRHRFAEVFARMINNREPEWNFSGDSTRIVEILKPWWEYLKSIGCTELLKSVGEKGRGKLFDYRNGFDHAWTMVKMAEGTEFEVAGQNYLSALREAVNRMESRQAFAWQPPAMEEKKPATVFLNLSNHPLTKWSDAQLKAARALGHGEPVEFEGGMPEVSPESDTIALIPLAADLAQRAFALGTAGTFVATDFTFAFILIQELKKHDIRCYATTSERRTQELPTPDGIPRKVTEFQFVRWREYK